MRRDPRHGGPSDDVLALGMVVAYSGTGLWRQHPEHVQAAKVVDMGPFALGAVRGTLEVDGDTIGDTLFTRAVSGQYVAVRFITGKPGVQLARAARLIMAWDKWEEARAELDAAADRAAEVVRQEHEAQRARREDIRARLAQAGVSVSVWKDFTEEDRVMLTAQQVRTLMEAEVRVPCPDGCGPVTVMRRPGPGVAVHVEHTTSGKHVVRVTGRGPFSALGVTAQQS